MSAPQSAQEMVQTQEWPESLQAAVDYFASRGLGRESNPRGTRRRRTRNVRKRFSATFGHLY